MSTDSDIEWQVLPLECSGQKLMLLLPAEDVQRAKTDMIFAQQLFDMHTKSASASKPLQFEVPSDGDNIEKPEFLRAAHLSYGEKGVLGNSVALNSENSGDTDMNRRPCVWRNAKKPGKEDQIATEILLNLRLEMKEKFKNKQTHKALLWAEIHRKIEEKGFFIGEGQEGRERCRQKFDNLQSAYMKVKAKRGPKGTGEGKIDNPPFFDILDEILGDCHKTEPVFVFDTMKQQPSSCLSSEQSASSSEQSSTSSEPSTSRFGNIKKSVRPAKVELLSQTLLKIHEENKSIRKEEMSTMVKMMEDQNRQRHEQVMGLLSIFKKNKKRPHSDSDDE